MLLIFSSFLIEFLKEIFLQIISIIITRINASKSESVDEPESEHHRRPSPLLVPVPPHAANVVTKANLTVSKYGNIIAEMCDDSCVICLTVLEEHDEVRELPNCRHVFHKDCIDAWIDKCKTSCPVCRSDLFPGRVEMSEEGGGDPWRRERMMYLFGEDY